MYGRIHNHCAAERKKQWQEENKELEIKPGDYVQAEVSDQIMTNKVTEHAWFQVLEIKGTAIKARLTHDLVNLNDLEDGDLVMMDRAEIEGYMSSLDEQI